MKTFTKTERRLIEEEILKSTIPGPDREAQLFKWLCGHKAFPRRRDFMEAFIHIPDKRVAGREIVPLTFNKAQRFVERIRLKFERDGLPFRGAILKARQFGLSTYWLAAMLELCTRNQHVRACLVADDEDLAKTLLETGKIMRDRLPFKLPSKYENRKQLYFDQPISSWIDIASAKAKDPCRGKTYAFLHATEPGTWKDPEKKVASVNQAVPNRSNTILSYEGTAKGVGNWWHDFWWKARNGKNAYYAFFFPWFYDWEFDYWVQPIEGDVEEIMGTLDDEERYLIKLGCNLGQLKWRRLHIRDSFIDDLDLFHQEFPATAEEAWLGSGRPVFNATHVKKAMVRARDPIWMGDVLVGEFDDGERRLGFSMSPNDRGKLKVWQHPSQYGTYVAAIDTAEGTAEGDYACIQVAEKVSGDQVAEWHGRVTPGVLGDIACCIGYHYNDAYLMPDGADGPGHATQLRIVERSYPNIALRPVYGVVGKRVEPKWGWDTNVKTKYLMVNECRAALAMDKPPEINSAELLTELMQYEIKDDNTYGPPANCHDDRVDAYCVLLMAMRDAMLRDIPDTPKKKPTTEAEIHWAEFEAQLEDDDEDDWED